MLYGKLNLLDTYAPFLRGPVWVDALNWLRSMPIDIAPGIHPLRGEHMFANVHGYQTLAREACRFESHRRYIDLQYCISGGERIEWEALDTLIANDEYDAQKDVQHYQSPEHPSGILRMRPDTFAIFRPEDGHMPKIADGIHPEVAKVVIKIDAGLFI